MCRVVFIVVVVWCFIMSANGGPTTEKRQKRGPKDLSDEIHFDPETNEHNTEYDHEAFLGHEEAEEFKNLSPEETRRRLRVIFKKIDVNEDSKVDNEELEKWIRHVANSHVEENTENQLSEIDQNKDGKMSLEEYIKATLGEIEDENAIYDEYRRLTFKEMKARDERRFKAADKDNNGQLDKEELAGFFHPEEYPHMRDILIDEALQDMDKDRDNHVTVEEYINDIWPAYEHKDNEPEPDWVKSEKEQFTKHRDKDGDKKLNRRELGDWIAPEGHDNALAESKHLIFNADKDKDGKLSIEELLENEDLFIGSQATNYGDYINRHDEF